MIEITLLVVIDSSYPGNMMKAVPIQFAGGYMRRHQGAVGPFLLSTMLALAVARPVALSSGNPPYLVLRYGGLTAVIYVVASVVADPDRFLQGMWSKYSLLPAILGCAVSSLIANSFWSGSVDSYIVFLWSIAYLGSFTAVTSALRWTIRTATKRC